MADAKHKVERAAFGAAIDGILKYVNKDETDREKAFLKLVDLSEKFMGDTFRKESYDAARRMIQIICHDNTVQIFTTGSRVIAAGLCLKILLNSLELIDKIQIQLQSVDDLLITGFDSIQLCLEALALICQIIAGIQHIRYLGVIGKSFPRCGRYHIFSLLICPDDVSYFFELLCACQRTSTEFHYF